MKLSKEKLLIILCFIVTLDKAESSSLISYWFTPKNDQEQPRVQENDSDTEEEVDFLNFETSGDAAVEQIGSWAQTNLGNLGSWTNNILFDSVPKVPDAELVNDYDLPQKNELNIAVLAEKVLRDYEVGDDLQATEVKEVDDDNLTDNMVKAELIKLIPVESVKEEEGPGVVESDENGSEVATDEGASVLNENQEEDFTYDDQYDTDEYKSASLFPHQEKDKEEFSFDTVYQDNDEYNNKTLFPDHSDSEDVTDADNFDYDRIYGDVEKDIDEIDNPMNQSSEIIQNIQSVEENDLTYDVYDKDEETNHLNEENPMKQVVVEDTVGRHEPVEPSKEDTEVVEEIVAPKIEIVEEIIVPVTAAIKPLINSGRRKTHQFPIVSNLSIESLKPEQDSKPNTSSSAPIKYINLDNNDKVTSKSFTANPLRSRTKVAAKAPPRPQLNVVELRKIFLDKLLNSEKKSSSTRLITNQTSLRKAVSRSNITQFLKEIGSTNSVDFGELKNKLAGEFEAELVAKIEPSKKNSSKIWTEKSWIDLCRSENQGFAQGIIDELHRLAPITMKKMPFLAPKDKCEAEILEGWLVDGLIVLYPTLDNTIPPKLTKEDAISLILFALITSEPDKISSEKPSIKLIMNELSRYDFIYPLSKFKVIDSTDPQIKSDLLAELIQIVNEKHLPYTFKAIESIRK